MICAWNELLAVLPVHLRAEVNNWKSQCVEEVRLRCQAPPELVVQGKPVWLPMECTPEDMEFIVNAASRYSPWAAATSSQGFLTVSGGHRIGLCGEVAVKEGKVHTFREVHSLCIRIARDFSGIAPDLNQLDGSIVILGAPGWGKTTLLRDLIRKLSGQYHICVADERGEIFPKGFDRGVMTDVLTGCEKIIGMEMLLRTMGPSYIAVDEITSSADSESILQFINCGITLLATAHAGSLEEFRQRSVYRPLVLSGAFQTFLVLHKDKSFSIERMTL